MRSSNLGWVGWGGILGFLTTASQIVSYTTCVQTKEEFVVTWADPSQNSTTNYFGSRQTSFRWSYHEKLDAHSWKSRGISGPGKNMKFCISSKERRKIQRILKKSKLQPCNPYILACCTCLGQGTGAMWHPQDAQEWHKSTPTCPSWRLTSH